MPSTQSDTSTSDRLAALSDQTPATDSPTKPLGQIDPHRPAMAIVTGGGSGIGAATAAALAQRGYAVAVLDLDMDGARQVAGSLAGEGNAASAWEVDVTDRDAMTEVAADIVSRVGGFDVVVNNAGVGMSAHFADATLDDWDWIRSVNLDGVINGCQVFGQYLLEQGSGHVVNMSSGLGYTPRATEIHYCTTKAAVLAFSRCLRADWSRQGVGVSAICPGIIDTPIYRRSRVLGDRAEPELRQRLTKLFNRGHSPAKVAEAVCKAIEENKGVVPVGWEARLGWTLNGLTPQWVETRMARLDLP